jgi:uncharacterized integral membrane protein
MVINKIKYVPNTSIYNNCLILQNWILASFLTRKQTQQLKKQILGNYSSLSFPVILTLIGATVTGILLLAAVDKIIPP